VCAGCSPARAGEHPASPKSSDRTWTRPQEGAKKPPAVRVERRRVGRRGPPRLLGAHHRDHMVNILSVLRWTWARATLVVMPFGGFAGPGPRALAHRVWDVFPARGRRAEHEESHPGRRLRYRATGPCGPAIPSAPLRAGLAARQTRTLGVYTGRMPVRHTGDTPVVGGTRSVASAATCRAGLYSL